MLSKALKRKCYDMENRSEFYERKNMATVLEVLQFYKLETLFRNLPGQAMLQFVDAFVFGPTTTYDSTLFHLDQLRRQYSVRRRL